MKVLKKESGERSGGGLGVFPSF